MVRPPRSRVGGEEGVREEALWEEGAGKEEQRQEGVEDEEGSEEGRQEVGGQEEGRQEEVGGQEVGRQEEVSEEGGARAGGGTSARAGGVSCGAADAARTTPTCPPLLILPPHATALVAPAACVGETPVPTPRPSAVQ